MAGEKKVETDKFDKEMKDNSLDNKVKKTGNQRRNGNRYRNRKKKVNNNLKDVSVTKKYRKRRIHKLTIEEEKMDELIEREDNMSIVAMILILFICFVVGISLGYLLYKLAINGAI